MSAQTPGGMISVGGLSYFPGERISVDLDAVDIEGADDVQMHGGPCALGVSLLQKADDLPVILEGMIHQIGAAVKLGDISRKRR